jgi:hypothetical protein
VSLVFPPASDSAGEFGERRSDAESTRDVEPEFVVAAANVLDEGVSGDDHGGCSIGAQAAWLARHPRVHLHFTPTGSSWLNQVERWFGFLDDQMIRRGVHKSVQALEHQIREWVEAWNEDPKPFVWKKTAEEILDSLARYLQHVSGSTARNQLMQRPSDAGH